MSLTESAATSQSCSLVVERKRWGPKRVGYVADYRCQRCHRGFTRKFHDRYPKRCPHCKAEVTSIRGCVMKRRRND